MRIRLLCLLLPCVVRLGLSVRVRHGVTPSLLGGLNHIASQLTSTLRMSSKELRNIDEEVNIVRRMIQIASVDQSLLDDSCRSFLDKETCYSDVTAYLKRCRGGRCMKLDYERHPITGNPRPIRLPNTYQLEAAFQVFGRFTKTHQPGNSLENTGLNSRELSKLYRVFLSSIIRANLFFPPHVEPINAFLSRYLYMATLYYKSYTTLETWKTALQNRLRVARYFFGHKIRKTLSQIISINLTSAFQRTSAQYILSVTSDLPEYFAMQRKGLTMFSRKYSEMVVDTLISTLGSLIIRSHRPWYRKMASSVGSQMKRIHLPTLNPFKRIWKKVGRKFGARDSDGYEGFVKTASELR